MATSLTSAQRIALIGGKRLNIPKEGWNADNFAAHGHAMIVALHRTARLTQLHAAPALAKKSLEIFKSQLKRIVRRYEQNRQHHRLGLRAIKAPVAIEVPEDETLWKEAIDFVLGESGIEIVTSIIPPIQSVMAQGYSKTSFFLSQETDAQASGMITRQARDAAQQIVSINDTTRNNILNAVKDAIDQQMTVTETADYVEKRVGTIFGNRALTIARTELNKAWTKGAALSYQQSDAVTHVSVIGCEAREKTSPQYNGESTCNYPDLPIDELNDFLDVGFHPNHTGTLVPSGFSDAVAAEV